MIMPGLLSQLKRYGPMTLTVMNKRRYLLVLSVCTCLMMSCNTYKLNTDMNMLSYSLVIQPQYEWSFYHLNRVQREQNNMFTICECIYISSDVFVNSYWCSNYDTIYNTDSTIREVIRINKAHSYSPSVTDSGIIYTVPINDSTTADFLQWSFKEGLQKNLNEGSLGHGGLTGLMDFSEYTGRDTTIYVNGKRFDCFIFNSYRREFGGYFHSNGVYYLSKAQGILIMKRKSYVWDDKIIPVTLVLSSFRL